MADQNQEQITIAESLEEEEQQQHLHRAIAMEPATYLLHHAPCTSSTPFCRYCSMKRPSPSSPAPAAENRAPKKLFREQQECTFYPATAAAQFHSPEHENAVATRASGSSPQPQSAKGFVLCDPAPSSSLVPTRTSSLPANWVADKGTILTTEEASNSMRLRRMKDRLREMRKWWDEVMPAEEEDKEEDEIEHDGGEMEKALSQIHRACKKLILCDPASFSSPVPTRTSSLPANWGRDKGTILTREEASNSMRLRRMKDRLREMKKWWEEVMPEEKEKQEDEDKIEHGGGENEKSLIQDENGGNDAEEEEAVRVEWVDKCLTIRFKCPCTKGYQILLADNNCYYKLL